LHPERLQTGEKFEGRDYQKGRCSSAKLIYIAWDPSRRLAAASSEGRTWQRLAKSKDGHDEALRGRGSFRRPIENLGSLQAQLKRTEGMH